MLLPVAFAAIGALAGATTARLRKGGALDMLQWAAVWAIIGVILGVLVTVIVLRAG